MFDKFIADKAGDILVNLVLDKEEDVKALIKGWLLEDQQWLPNWLEDPVEDYIEKEGLVDKAYAQLIQKVKDFDQAIS